MDENTCPACAHMPAGLFCISHTCIDCGSHVTDVESHVCVDYGPNTCEHGFYGPCPNC